MASKKNLSDKVLERVQEKRRNTSSYSAANTDKDKSIAERSIELAQKRMAERAAMAAARRAAEEASAQSAPPARPDASLLQDGRARTNLYGTGFGRAYHDMFTQPHLDAQEKARQAAADRILGEFGYKNIAGRVVFTTPHNQLPKPTEENTASLMQAPGAYGIKPQDFAQAMADIKAFKTMKKPEAAIEPPEVDFIAKWFPDAEYEPSAMDMMDKADELTGEQLNEYYADYEAYVANADKVRDNDQTAREYEREYPEAEARYNAAIRLLGEDALNYLEETTADYYGRYANLHKSHANNTDDWWDAYKAKSRMTEEIGLEEANRLERYNSNISDAPGGAARWSQTTKKERAMYEYMREMYGHEAAEGYIESIFPVLNQRLAAATQELATEFAEENPVLASAGTVAEAPTRGIEFAGMMLDHYLGKDVDAYDPRLNKTRHSDTVRSVVPQDMGGFGKFAYSTGMSIADNLANRLTYGWIPYVGSTLQSVNMGASGGASTYIDVYERTGDKDLAMAAATASGAVETIFEKISLDKLIKMGEPGTWKTAIVNVLKQMGIEGSEELATSIANELTDRYLMGENSNYELAVKHYMKQGNSEDAARRLANMDFAKQAAMDFAGGTASGLVMGGSQQAGSYFAARSYENAKGTQPAAPTENDQTEQLDADIEEQVSIAARQAAEVLERESAMPPDEVMADYMETSAQPEAETPAVQQPAQPAVETPAAQQPARPAVETPAAQQPARPAAETPAAQQTSQPASTAQEERTQPSTPVQSERTQPETRQPVDYSDRTGAKKITGRSFMSELNAVSPDRMRGGRNVTITDAYRNENGSLMLVGENKKGRTITAEQSILLDHQSITENLLDNIAHFAPSIGYGENSAVEINECVKNYDSMLGSKKEYVKDFDKVYQYAQMGMTPEEIKAEDAYKGHLSDKAFEAAYNLGAKKAPNVEFKTQDQQREEAAEAYKQSGQKPENAIEFADGSVFAAGTVKMDGNSTELTPVALSTNENGERVITAVDSNGKTHTAALSNTMFADRAAQTLFGRFMVDTFDIDQHRDHRGIANLLTDEALPAYIDSFDASRVSGEDVETKAEKYAKEFYRVYKAGERGQTLEQMADGNEGILDRIHEVLSDETIDRAYAAGQNTPEAQKARRVADVNAQKTAEANAKAEAAKPAPETKTEAAKPAAQPVPETKAADKPAAQERTEEKPKKSRGKTQLFHAEQGATYTDENGDQHNLDVLGVESVDNGMPVLQVRDENGEIDYLSASELDIEGSYGELMAYEGVARMDAKALRNYLEGYNPDIATPKQYAKVYNAVYQRAVSGLDFEQAYNRSNMARAHMSKAAATDAYAAGLNVFNANHESVQAAETRNDVGAHVVAGNAPLSAQEGRKGGKISKRYTQAAFANMSKEGRNNAIAQMEMLSALASRTGRTIVVEDSIVGPNGTQANAYYDPKTGEIHIALDAVGGAYTYAAMHELTHAIKAEHKQEWGGFVDFVKGALEKNGSSFDQLVQYQMDRFGYTRALAEEEVICNTVPALLQDDRNVLELYRGNRTLFERVVDWVRGLLQDIKAAGDVLSKRSASWAQMDALKNDRQTLQEMYDRMMAIFEKGPELRADDQVAEFERNMVEGVTASVTEAPVGENGEPIKYSLTTYNETLPKPISVGRAKAMGLEYEVQKLGAKGKRTVAASGRDVTEALMRKEGFDDKTINKVLKYADKISKWFEKAVGRYEFVNLQDVNDASIMIDHNTGEIKFSCQVPNSEYKVNFDFTTVCRQREAVQRFIDDLAKEKGANGTKLEDIQLTPQNIFKLNTILKNEGYETACLGCFVEAKRYRIKQQADTLVEEWNALVLAQNPDAEYFGFATGDTDLMKMSNDEVTKLEASMRAYSTKGTSKATDRAARLVQLPEMQKLLRPSDFISRQGRQKIREFSPALESFLASRFGQGGAKPAVGFMPYNSEVAALPDTKSVGGKRMTLQQYLKNLGGGRSNSFSDYIPSHALDYLQRTIDMAARKLPAQCYTKVPGRARTFGMTGEKINMSVMFDIDPDVHWSSAGLGKNNEYLVGDKARADKIEKETGERPFTQSFPWEEAVAIEHDPRYAENCGIIGVGYSYKHILKMMADGNIPYIIAYHRSAMPDSVAKASNTKHATNYEPVQNNTRVTGYAVVTNLQDGEGVPSYATWPEGKKKTKASDMTWDMQAALKRNNGNAKAVITEWQAWMVKNNLTPVTSTAEAGHGKFDVYASLNRTMDPAKTAEEYMRHCIENGMLPVFYEFATIENYDKHLFDFSVRNLATGTVAPQKNVSFDFMDRVTEDDFMAMLDADMTEYNDYNRDQFHSEKWGRVKDTAYEELKFSLRDTDENVQDALSAEQKAFNLVKGHRINAAEADKIAGEVLKQANSDYDRQKLAAEISRIYDYVERGVDVDWLQVDDETTSLMAKVMESSKSINLEHEEMAKPIREFLRKTGISLTDAQRKQAESMSGTYGAYRKQLFGKVRLTAMGGTSLNDVWAQLSAMNSELFPANASEAEQTALLVAAVDALKPVYVNNSGMNVEESASWLAGKMNEAYFSLPSVKASAKSGKTFGDSIVQLKDAMKRFEETSWSEYQNALRSIKEARGSETRTKKQEEVAALRQKYVNWREKDTAQRKERELVNKYRGKVERSAKTLANWIDKPTDAKHIPMNVEKSVREMLGVLDFSGKGTKTATDLANHLNALADSLKEAQEGEDENRTMFLERDQQMIDEIKRLSEIIKGNAVHDARSGKGVYDLNGLELKELSKWLDVIKHTVTKAGQMRGSNLPGNTVEEVAAASMFEIGKKKAYKDRSNISKALGQVYGPDMQDSFSFFERLGPTTNAVFKELRKGFDTMAGLVGEAEERTRTILDGLNIKKISGKKAEKHKFQLKSGEVDLTTGQIMELYVLSKRQQAQGHLYGGGFRVQGDQNARPYTIDEEELARITATLTPEERNAADGMQAFLSKECAAWGNKTSVELLGYKKFGEEFYWPISTDPNQRNTTKLEDNFGANISAIKNQGMTKALTEGASNALVIGDIFDTYTRHISNMAAYSAYALPLSDFTRWYNARGVKTEIEHAMGKKGIDYINQFLMALNGSSLQEQKSGLAKITSVMTRNAKIAAVGANVRVVVQQPTSYARAAMYMSPKYLSAALTMKNPDEDLVNKYCGIARWKRWGFYETNVGPNLRQLIVGDTSFADKTREAMTAPAAAGDNWTINHLWNACELETRAMYPELQKGSEEYYTQVGNRMSEIIDRTQVVDSVFHRSQMMRSKNWINQTLTNFMAEPTKTYNMLMSAISDYSENRNNKAARNRVARAFGVYAMTGVLTAAAAALVDAFRDDDEEKKWTEKYLSALKGNTIDNLNPIGLLPGASDIMSMLEGFESSRLDTQGIQRLINVAQEIKKWNDGESKLNEYGRMYKTMQAVSSLSGIPVSNLMRDVNAVWQTVTGTSPTLNAEARKEQTVDLLYGAITKGKKAEETKLRDELYAKAGMSPKDVETAIARKLTNDQRVIDAYAAKENKDYRTANKLINELTALGFDREAVDKAITLHEPKEPAEKDPDAKLRVKLYKAEDVANAIKVLAGMESGNATEMDVKTMMFELAVDSNSQTDINVQIRNDIANVLKPEYLAMAEAGDEEGMRRLESLLENLFEYEDYDIKEKMHGWVKTQHSDALKTAVQAYNLTDALKAVEVMRGDGKTDSEIKSSLSSYKQIYIDAVRAGDSETALKIQRTLMGLGLKGKTGKALYTSQTFTDWLRN